MPLRLTILVFLVMAAWRDIATRTIPDAIGLLLLATSALMPESVMVP